MDTKKVVVTGLGLLCPLGNDVETAWKAMLQGKSGIRSLPELQEQQVATQFAGVLQGFDPTRSLEKKELRRIAPFIQFAVDATAQAMADAQLEIDEHLSARAGVAIGSGIGGLGWIESNHDALLRGGPGRVSPFFIPGSIINMASGYPSMRHNLCGPNISVATACTTGAHNIGLAARLIANGDADVMVCGGSEMATDVLGVSGFNAVRALSKRNDAPALASRPFDRDRDGFVLSEGAGVLVLESYEHALARGAKMYAQLAGFGMSADAYHVTAPDPSGIGFVRAMQSALGDAKLSPDAIDYINAHATSTPMLDPLECQAIRTVFGRHVSDLAISATKSMTGHLLGAAGALEAIVSILSLRDQQLPPTINLDNPIEECDGLNMVAHHAQSCEIRHVLSNSFGFGGTNASLIFSHVTAG